MRLTDRLSQPQRIVVVIALGLVLGAAGTYLVSPWNPAAFGWYAYAPLSHTPLSQTALPLHTGPAGWLRLVIWLALICLWALVSIRVLRPSPAGPPR